MKINNKGFAISTVMYMVLVLAVLVMSLTLTILNGRKLIIDKQKKVAALNIYTKVGNSTPEPETTFPVVFSIDGPCYLHAYTGNITGANCKDANGNSYTNASYINTGIKLFDTTNWEKDFEIKFKFSDYDSTTQPVDATNNNNQQNTILNAKYENADAHYTGFVFRKNGSSLTLASRNDLQNGTQSKSDKTITYSDGMVISIVRKNKVVYYSVDGGVNYEPLQSYATPYTLFDVPVYFGATLIDGDPHRLTVCTLSNIRIRMGVIDDPSIVLPTT